MPDPTAPPPAIAAGTVAAPPARTFAQFFGEIEDGGLALHLTDEYRGLVRAITDAAAAGRKGRGKLTIALDFTCAADGLVEVRADTKTKLPEVARGRTVFWSTPEDHLSRSNPRQFAMPLHDVNRAGPARTVA